MNNVSDHAKGLRGQSRGAPSGYWHVLILSRRLQRVQEQRFRKLLQGIRLEEEFEKRRPRTCNCTSERSLSRNTRSAMQSSQAPSRPGTRGRLITPGLTASRPNTRQQQRVKPAQTQAQEVSPAKRQPLPAESENNGNTPNDKASMSQETIEINEDGDGISLKAPTIVAPMMPSFPQRPDRESTTFNVFSNLSSYKRNLDNDDPIDEEQCTLATSGSQTKILQSTRKNDSQVVRRMLYDNPKMPLNFADENGQTILHHAVNAGSDEIVQLVLKKNGPLNYSDKNGDTALHLCARAGHVLNAYYLLQKGAKINRTNKLTGRTALHDAVIGQHRHVTELLLYNGIDITIKDNDGRLAEDLCSGSFNGAIFKHIRKLISDKRIEIQEISLSSTSLFRPLDLIIDIQTESSKKVLAVCSRDGVGSLDAEIKLDGREEVVSDAISCYIVNIPPDIRATITMPIYDVTWTSREEVVVKNVNGRVIVPDKVVKGENCWLCVFSLTLSQMDTFVAVCRPKAEVAEVGKDAFTMTSSVDENIRIIVNKNSFNKPASLCLEVLELADDVEIEEGQILSSTPYYKISCDKQFSGSLTVELPAPSDYGEEGDILVLTQRENKWAIVNKFNKLKDGKGISFTVPSLPIHAVVIKVIPSYNKDGILSEVEKVFKLVQTSQHMVSFLCLTKKVVNTNRFQVVVECCDCKVVDARRRSWVSQGFQEQQQRTMVDKFPAVSKQKYDVRFYENSVARKGEKILNLSFHPKRENVLQFEVTLQGGDVKFINGRIYIYREPEEGEVIDKSVEREPLTMIDVSLVSNKFNLSKKTDNNEGNKESSKQSRSSSRSSLSSKKEIPSRPDSAKRNGNSAETKSEEKADSLDLLKKSLMIAMDNVDPVTVSESEPETTPQIKEPPKKDERKEIQLLTEGNNSKIVFLQDQFLDSLIEEIGEEWYKIFVLMGVTFSDVEEVLQMSGAVKDKVKRLFRDWRNQKQEREDVGLPLLLAALFKGGRRDVANTVQIALKFWYENHKDKEGEFYKWITKAYQDSNLLVPTDYPKPMSDPYLVLMSDELQPSHDLAHALSLSETEADEILNDEHFLFDGIRSMKMLTLFRESVPIKIDSLNRLLQCLQELPGCSNLRNYGIMCAKAWVKRTATRKDDPFRYQVDALVKRLE